MTDDEIRFELDAAGKQDWSVQSFRADCKMMGTTPEEVFGKDSEVAH